MESRLMISDEELDLLLNRNFFDLKSSLTKKLSALLSDLRDSINNTMESMQKHIPEEALHSTAKISRGENYKGYPWMVLDYPRVFNKEHVFAFRSLCWWGHEFSFTLHLSGTYFETVKKKLPAELSKLIQQDIYICLSNTPWDYHFEKNNYIPVIDFLHEHDPVQWFEKRDFIKISRKVNLKDYMQIKQEGNDFLMMLLKMLYQ